MKNVKRTLALALVLCLTLSMGILVASAAEEPVTYKLYVADVVTAGSGDYLNANGQPVEMTAATNSATGNDNYRAAMTQYFGSKIDMVLIAAKKANDNTRCYYTTAGNLSASYPKFEDGFYMTNTDETGWSAFLVRNPGNGSYDVSFDYYKTPATANAVDVYAMPASVVLNTTLIPDERGFEFALTHTVKTGDVCDTSSPFGNAIEAAVANGTAVKLGSSKDMTETGDASQSAKATASLTDNKLTFANDEDMIIMFKNVEKENASTSYARQLIYGVNMTKVASAPTDPTQPEATQPTQPDATQPTQPGATQPTQSDGPAQTGETAPVMLLGMLMVISLAAVCVICKKRAA